MAEDALACFKILLDNIPVWIADLEDLATSSKQAQKDMLFERQPVQRQEATSQREDDCCAPQKDSSKNSGQESAGCSSSNDLLRPQIPLMTGSDALRLSQRKRKTLSACSDIHSGPSKYRSKAMIVVYYDGNVQKRFEGLVRSIGSSRNSLRKGKISAKVSALSRSKMETVEPSSDGESPVSGVNSPERGMRDQRNARDGVRAKSEDTEAFDKADGFLAKAQDLCERAAHQVLRDGDCSVELKQASKLITEAQEIGVKELPKLQRHAEIAAEQDRLVEESGKLMQEGKISMDGSETPSETLVSVAPRNSSQDSLEIDTEAEDSDADTQDTTLDAIRFEVQNMRRMRNAAG